MSERIQKYLSNLGYGSRREVEDWIVEGRLVVNGAPAEIGQKIGEDDAVKLDGKRLSLKGGNEPLKVLLYKKRTGEMVTRDDPEGRRTVFRKLPELETGRWIAVGRLDVNTSGLLLMTNHGELARRLMHPSFEQRREYAVRALGELPEGFMQRLQSGVQLEDGPAHFESIRFGDNEIEDDEGDAEGGGGGRANHWFVVTITEGRHREVRRLFESQGLTVNRLIRTAYGPLKLGRGIKSGSYREATKDEIGKLLDAVDLDHREALPERVRESHRERSEFPQGGKPKAAERTTAPARGKATAKPAPVENTGPKPKFRSGAEGWSKASREERKQVDRYERFEKDRPGVHRPPHELSAPAAKPWAKKPAAVPVGVGGEPEQFKARGFGARSERSYAERGDSAPPPRGRERVESSRPYKTRADATGERSAYAKKPYGDRPRPAAGEGRPAYAKKPYGDRPARSESGERPAYAKKPYGDRPTGERPAYAKKPYGDRPARSGDGERPEFKPRVRRDEGGAARPAYAKKPYGDRPARGEGAERPAYKPRAPREDGGGRPSFAKKPYGDRAGRSGEGERPSFRPRAEGGERPSFRDGERKPYGGAGAKPAGERRPYGAKSDTARPAREGGYRGDKKPFAPRAPAAPGKRYVVKDGLATTQPKLGLGARSKKRDGDED